MLTNETVKRIFEEERSSKKLAKIDENFFYDVSEYLAKRGKSLNSERERWEFESVKKRVQAIFEMRQRKILSMAIDNLTTGFVPENLTSFEKELFDKIVEVLRNFNRKMREMKSVEKITIEKAHKFLIELKGIGDKIRAFILRDFQNFLGRFPMRIEKNTFIWYFCCENYK